MPGPQPIPPVRTPLEIEACLLDSEVVAHPSDSCVVVFIEIAADLEGQLDIISEVPEVPIRFSPDGRLPHTPSLVRTAA